MKPYASGVVGFSLHNTCVKPMPIVLQRQHDISEEDLPIAV